MPVYFCKPHDETGSVRYLESDDLDSNFGQQSVLWVTEESTVPSGPQSLRLWSHKSASPETAEVNVLHKSQMSAAQM